MVRCKSFKGASVSVTPNPLEVHADSVKFTAKADIPPKSGFRKKGVYSGKLLIRQSGLTYDVSTVTVSQEQYPDIKKSGASITHRVNTAFKEEWDRGKLIAQPNYQRKKKNVTLPELELASCCITTPRLVCLRDFLESKTPEEANLTVSSWNPYTPAPPTDINAKFQFPKDVYKIQPNEYEKGEIKNIVSLLNSKKNTSKITLAGYASPEGPFARNQKLAINRLKEVQNWLIEQLKQNGYTAYLDSTFFTLSTTSEDWQGFKNNLEQMAFDKATKDEIIRIASEAWNEDLKERKIMAIVGGADKVEVILAPLRRTTIRIQGASPDLSKEEIQKTLTDFLSGRKKSADLQGYFKSPEQMAEGIANFKSNSEKKKLFAEYAKLYPDDWRGHNDYGVYAMLEGDIDGGVNSLRTANAKKPQDPTILNNIGIGLMAMKNYTEALKYFEESHNLQKTPLAAYVLGLEMIKRAKYPRAVEYLQYAISRSAEKMGLAPKTLGCAQHNLGLAQLLVNEAAESKKALEASIDKANDYALSYYVLAILGARNGDETIVVTNLQKAIQLDKKLGEKAVTDLEFRKFHNSEAFKRATAL
jgi:tetratricopeptide (TPR) repeat protein